MTDEPGDQDRANGDDTAVPEPAVNSVEDASSRPQEDPAIAGSGDAVSSDEPDRLRRGRGIPVAPAVLLLAAVAIGLLLAFTDAPTLTVLGAVLLFLVIIRVGWFFLQQFATPPPPPPDPGTLRRVRLTYRCPVCGAEVRMTSAATEDPEPPRHCMDEMELVKSED